MVNAHTRPNRRFTVDEVLRMEAAGIFDQGESVELIEGDLVVMSPIGPRHVGVATRVASRLYRTFDLRVRTAAPVVVGDDSLPEPDIAVIGPNFTDDFARHPRGDELILAVEVARSSLVRDRQKALLYASGGVPVYWLIDVERRRVVVHAGLVDDVYTEVRVVQEGDELFVPESGDCWAVAELLPAGV